MQFDSFKQIDLVFETKEATNEEKTTPNEICFQFQYK